MTSQPGSVTPKPHVFKICGTWIWQCDHGYGPMGDQFRENSWAHPWDACFAAATKHTMLYHRDGEVVEVIELP